MADEFTIKDSGERSEFEGGMVRDSATDKLDYTSLLFGPMLDRYIAHLTKGREKYPDPEPGVPNWTLAQGEAELVHAKRSLLRHMFQLLRNERDEDHAAAVWFNVNLIEYIRDRQRNLDLNQIKQEWSPGIITSYEPLGAPGLDNGPDEFTVKPGEWDGPAGRQARRAP